MSARVIDFASRLPVMVGDDGRDPDRKPLPWDVEMTTIALVRNGTRPRYVNFRCHIIVDPEEYCVFFTVNGEMGDTRTMEVRGRRTLGVSDWLAYCLGVPA